MKFLLKLTHKNHDVKKSTFLSHLEPQKPRNLKIITLGMFQCNLKVNFMCFSNLFVLLICSSIGRRTKIKWNWNCYDYLPSSSSQSSLLQIFQLQWRRKRRFLSRRNFSIYIFDRWRKKKLPIQLVLMKCVWMAVNLIILCDCAIRKITSNNF